MSLENAKANLKEFGKELNLEGLEFDENNTCILGIDDQFSLHLTYEPNSKMLYMYAPLLDGLPRDDQTRLKLYERLLEGSMLGGQMAGGGVGVAVKEELILIHVTIPMEHAESNELRRRAPTFVERVEHWRKVCEDIRERREEGSSVARPPMGQPMGPSMGPQQPSKAPIRPGPGPGGPGQGPGWMKG
jgi:hypothetical protein